MNFLKMSYLLSLRPASISILLLDLLLLGLEASLFIKTSALEAALRFILFISTRLKKNKSILKILNLAGGKM